MKHSEEAKEKIRQANIGKKLSSETRKKMSEAKKGKKKPEGFNKGREITWKDKISKAHTGKKLSDETKKKLSDVKKGKPAHNKGVSWGRHTEEAKEKIAQAGRDRDTSLLKKRIVSMETRAKLSKASKGRKLSEETKEKIRQANLGKKREYMRGKNNPMHKHPNAYRSKFGKTGFREDLGLFLKSRWEANMLRIFLFLGFSVEYEPQSFVLSDGTTYCPDFLLHETGELIEVKGRWIKDAKRRFDLFKKEYPGLSIEIIGPKKYSKYLSDFKTAVPNLEK